MKKTIFFIAMVGCIAMSTYVYAQCCPFDVSGGEQAVAEGDADGVASDVVDEVSTIPEEGTL